MSLVSNAFRRSALTASASSSARCAYVSPSLAPPPSTNSADAAGAAAAAAAVHQDTAPRRLKRRASVSVDTSGAAADLDARIAEFVEDIEKYKIPSDGKGVLLASAWLVSDNALVSLLADHFPGILQGMNLVGIDTLHLFDETLEVAEAVQATYGKKAKIYKPAGVSTRAEFAAKYGDCETMNHADFDFVSKVEPFQRAIAEANASHILTGRRADQGSQRIQLDVWEPDKKTLNPLSKWSWSDITRYVDDYEVPYNTRHHYVYRSAKEIPATERHRDDLDWEVADLGKPYWRAAAAELVGDSDPAAVYVNKSFGDVHTSVAVTPAESERAGRFVRVANTECGLHTRTAQAGAPHGGVLVNLMAAKTEAAAVAEEALSCRAPLELTARQACDVHLLCDGTFSPLTGFMTENEYESVVETMRLPEQQLFGMPVVLDWAAERSAQGKRASAPPSPGESLLLKRNGVDVAVLQVESSWKPDKVREAHKVYGTAGLDHPGVQELALHRANHYVGGRLIGLNNPPSSIPFGSPRELRASLAPGQPLVVFQCRNPIHRAHHELFTRVRDTIPDAAVLVHPTCGPTQESDIEANLRVATYEVLKEELDDPNLRWSYLPYSMHMAGPREAIQHMIMRKNYGATHFIIGRDMAGSKSTITGEDFYGPYDAQELAEKYKAELGIEVVPFQNLVYTEERGYVAEDEAAAAGLHALKLSGTEFRRRLRAGEEIPSWFAFPSVVNVLREAVNA